MNAHAAPPRRQVIVNANVFDSAAGVLRPGSTLKIEKLEDLAGHIVGVESATNNERKLKEANDAWVAKGGKPADIRSFKTATETVAALRAGQL